MEKPRFFKVNQALGGTLAVAVLAWSGAALAIETWQVGGSGSSWESSGEMDGVSVDDNGRLAPAAVNPARNALGDIRQRNGFIRSPQSRTDLTAVLSDGNEETIWEVTRERRPNGASMVIDLGAILPISRIRVLGAERKFLRAYELFVHNGDPDELRDDFPLAFTNQVKTNLEQDEPVIDVEIPLQFVRFIRLVCRSEQEFTIRDVEVFGDGFASSGRFISKVIDLGESANFGLIEALVQRDSLTSLVLQTRSGSTPEPFVYHRKVGLLDLEGGERTEEPILPLGSLEAKEEYESLATRDKGRIADNLATWSPWSAPYEDFSGIFLSPGNNRFVQFRLLFASQDTRRGAAIELFSFQYSIPTLARTLVAEISPGQVVLGESHTFDYYLLAEFDQDNPGFDRIEIATPFRSTLTSVELDGTPVAFEKEEEDGRLSVVLTGERVSASGQLLHLSFNALVTVYGTTFFGRVSDTQSGELGQDILPGDAISTLAHNSLSVRGELRRELVLDLQAVPSVFTPNGDGVNDELRISYILLRALNPVPVELGLYDLTGRHRRRLRQVETLNGPQLLTWDGRDDAGQAVPPGLYILKLSVEMDTAAEDRALIVGVAY